MAKLQSSRTIEERKPLEEFEGDMKMERRLWADVMRNGSDPAPGIGRAPNVRRLG